MQGKTFKTSNLCHRCSCWWWTSCLVLVFTATRSLSAPVVSEHSWGAWSDCNRDCGAGVQARSRLCAAEGEEAVRECVEEQFRSCCIQLCPEGAPNFRELQCSAALGGDPYKWKPDPTVSECKLACVEESGKRFEDIQVLDGTPCSVAPNGSAGLCLNNSCIGVGCDGVLGSGKVKDECLRCVDPLQPPTVSCAPINGTYSRSDTHLEEECTGECFSPSRRRFVSCVKYNGTEIVLEQDSSRCDPEKKDSPEEPCAPTCAVWVAGPWGECTTSCGQGTKQRNITCMFDGVPSDSCSGPREADILTCNNESCPTPAPAPAPACVDKKNINCQLAVEHYGCNAFYSDLCCATCSGSGQS